MAQGAPLPLAGDGSARFLPWLVALMVFLAAIAIMVAGIVGSAVDRWDNGMRGTLTVEVPGGSTTAEAAAAPSGVDAALSLMRHTRGVIQATPLSQADMMRLLKPWLGSVDAGLLPLPLLIDLKVEPDVFDRANLEEQLASIVPGATIQQHAAWLNWFYRAARLIEIAGGVLVLLIGGTAAIAIVFTTRTGLALYAPLIDLLHLMGASDSYIARQFQNQAFRLALRGGIFGLVLSVLAFGACRLLAEGGTAQPIDVMLGAGHMPIAVIACLVALPIVVGLVSLATARITVLRALARMP